jgi:hypothetical protein
MTGARRIVSEQPGRTRPRWHPRGCHEAEEQAPNGPVSARSFFVVLVSLARLEWDRVMRSTIDVNGYQNAWHGDPPCLIQPLRGNDVRHLLRHRRVNRQVVVCNLDRVPRARKPDHHAALAVIHRPPICTSSANRQHHRTESANPSTPAPPPRHPSSACSASDSGSAANPSTRTQTRTHPPSAGRSPASPRTRTHPPPPRRPRPPCPPPAASSSAAPRPRPRPRPRPAAPPPPPAAGGGPAAAGLGFRFRGAGFVVVVAVAGCGRGGSGVVVVAGLALGFRGAFFFAVAAVAVVVGGENMANGVVAFLGLGFRGGAAFALGGGKASGSGSASAIFLDFAPAENGQWTIGRCRGRWKSA